MTDIETCIWRPSTPHHFLTAEPLAEPGLRGDCTASALQGNAELDKLNVALTAEQQARKSIAHTPNAHTPNVCTQYP